MKLFACLTLVMLALLALPGGATAAELRGMVLGPDDVPLAGAEVLLLSAAGPARTAVTDRAGRYVLRDVETGRCTLIARKKGYALQRQVVQVTGTAQVLGVHFRLRSWAAIPWSVHGTVLAPDGKTPAAGAQVRLQREILPGRPEDAGETTTNETGAFAFTDLRRGSYRLSVSAPEYLPAPDHEFALRDAGSRHTADLVLVAPPPETVPGTLQVQVLDAQGRPAANKQIQVALEGDSVATQLQWGNGMLGDRDGQEFGGVIHHDLRGTVPADAQGRFEVTVPPGTYSLEVSAPGLLAKSLQVVVPPGKRSEPALFRLPAGPVPPDEPPGEQPGEMDPGPGREPPTGDLEGVVLLPDGKPLKNCGLYLFLRDAARPREEWDGPWGAGLEAAYVVTDAAGRFAKKGLPPRSYTVVAKTRGYAQWGPVSVTISAKGKARLSLRLKQPALRAAGRVVGADGKPVASALVFAARPEAMPPRGSPGFFDVARMAWNWERRIEAGPWPADTPANQLKPGVIAGLLFRGFSYAVTDDHGAFSLGDLDPGSYRVGATAVGWSPSETTAVTLAAGGKPKPISLAMAPLGAVEGTLYGPDGKPFVGGVVGWGSHRVTRTDAAGHYRLVNLPPAVGSVWSRDTGFPQVTRSGLTVKAGKTTAGVDLRLSAGLTLTGRVLKADGSPAAGARVQCSRGNPGSSASRIGGALAGADGAFSLRGLPAGQVTLTAVLRGFVPAQSGAVLPQPANHPAEIRLAAGATLRGTVRSDDGKPLRAWISWYSESPAFQNMDYRFRQQNIETGADGAFSFVGLPAGRVRLSANSSFGYLSREVTVPAAGGEKVVDLVLARPGSIEGTVAGPDGTPARSTALTAAFSRTGGDPAGARPYGESWTRSLQTDAQGRFRIPSLPAGTYRVRLRMAGAAGAEREGVVVASAKPTAGLDFRMAPGLSLRGRVLLPDGKPAAGASVRCCAQNMAWTETFATGADGSFTAKGLDAGRIVVAVTVGSFPGMQKGVTLPQKEGEPFLLRLPAPMVLRGTVLDDARKPISGAKVLARIQGASYTRRNALTDAAGRFRFAGLPRAYGYLSVQCAGHQSATRNWKTPAAGADVVLDISLARTSAIEGRVLLPNGKPLAHTRIACSIVPAKRAPRSQPWYGYGFTTNAEGRYRLGSIAPGSYRLRIRPAGYPPAERAGIVVTRSRPATGADFRLVEGISLKVKVLGPDGTPLAQAMVWCSQPPGQAPGSPARTNWDGSFVLRGLVRGAARVSASFPGLRSQAAAVTLPQDAAKPLEIRLQAGITVRGTVRDRDGKPIENASVNWSPRSAQGAPYGYGYENRYAQTDGEGQYSLPALPAGPVMFQIYRDGYFQVSETRTIPEGAAEASFDFNMDHEQYGRLRGRVLLADGRPAPRCTVTAGAAGGRWYGQSGYSEGQFTFRAVLAGRGWLSVRSPSGGTTVRVPYEARAGEENVVPDIRLPGTGSLSCTVAAGAPLPAGARLSARLVPVPAGPEGKPLPAGPPTRLYAPGAAGYGQPLAEPLHALPVFLESEWISGWDAYPAGTALLMSGMPTRAALGRVLAEQAGGRFSAAGIVEGSYRVQPCIAAGASSALQPGAAVVVAAGKETKLQVATGPWGTVSGRVKGAPAPPAPPARPGGFSTGRRLPQLSPGGGVGGFSTGRRLPQLSLGGGVLFHTGTGEYAGTAPLNSDGTFTLAGLAPGDYTATMCAPDQAPARVPVHVAAGETARIELELAPGVSLGGKVAGKLPRGVIVCVENAGCFGAARPFSDGTFTIEHLLPGTYTLRAWSPNAEQIVTVEGVRVGESGAGGVKVEWK